MLSDTHTAGVATALALCLTTNRIAIGSKCGTYKRRPQYTHTNFVTNLVMSKPNDYRILIMWEAVTQSQRLSITLLYLDTGNNLADMKFKSRISVNWDYCAGGCLVLRRRTVPEQIMRNTVYRLFSIYYAIYCDTTYRAIHSFDTIYRAAFQYYLWGAFNLW